MVELLKKNKLLEGLSEEQVLKFTEICEEATFGEGAVIIHSGAIIRNLYLIIEGICDVEMRTGLSPEPLIVGSLKENDIFGEMCFLDGEPRATTVKCKKTSKVVMINIKNFENLSKERPDITTVIMRNIACILVKRIRSTNSLLREAYLQSFVGTH